MDRTEATPEGLPPLELRKLRDLDVEREQADASPHVSSASAIVRRGDFVYVIGDEEHALAVFRGSSAEPGELRQALADESGADGGDLHNRKPDVEAMTAMPPFPGAPYGGLLGLGSGSKSSRDRGFFWRFDADGSLLGDAHEVDLKPLYELLRERIGELNVEGAAVLGESFWLFHRGNAEGSQNAAVELRLDEVMRSMTGDRELSVVELEGVRSYDLGELEGVPLCFSDATTVSNELIVFTASAEADDADGADAIRGSVVGTISADGEVRRLRVIDRRWKVEGVHAAVDTGVIDFVFVCDQDADGAGAPLLSAMMPAAEGLETDS